MNHERLPPNKALHRTAICAWGFALEFVVFICQFVAVGGRSGTQPSTFPGNTQWVF